MSLPGAYAASGPPSAHPESDRWTVQSLWVGGQLSSMEWASIESFLQNGASYLLYTDNPALRVPRGVQLKDAHVHFGDKIPTYGPRAGTGKGSFAIAANIARLKTLVADGGWWVDTDVICLKSFKPIDSGLRFGYEDENGGPYKRGAINVAVIRMPPGHPLGRVMLQRCLRPWLGSPWEKPTQRLRNFVTLFDTIWRPENVPWGYSGGPTALTHAVEFFKFHQVALPPDVFYPIRWDKWRNAVTMQDAEFQALAERAYAVHLWAEMYRRENLDRNAVIKNCDWAQRYLKDYVG